MREVEGWGDEGKERVRRDEVEEVGWRTGDRQGDKDIPLKSMDRGSSGDEISVVDIILFDSMRDT